MKKESGPIGGIMLDTLLQSLIEFYRAHLLSVSLALGTIIFAPFLKALLEIGLRGSDLDRMASLIRNS